MDVSFIDNALAVKNPDDYEIVPIDVAKAVKSFQLSIYSFEVMNKDGSLRSDEDLNERQHELRRAVRAKLEKNEPLPRPMAGIGINDNFELKTETNVCSMYFP